MADAKYDAKTKMDPWAYMCEPHFKAYGIGLGVGKGQMLKQHRDTSYGNERPSSSFVRIIQQNSKLNRP